jgi:acylphosphatase
MEMEEKPNQPQRLHAQIEGRVQGVGFRAFVEQNAIMLRLSGWVRNRWNGSVEVVAEGERQDLERLLTALQRGPRSAYVTKLDVNWGSATGEFYGFSVLRTG